VAAYSFGEGTGTVVADASGNGNTGSLASGVTWTTAGRFGSALAFNGASFVTIPSAASLSLTTAMTLEAWVYPTGKPSKWNTVVMKEQPGEFVYALFSGSSAKRPYVYFNTATTSSGERGAAGTWSLPFNTWSHLGGTYDGASLKFYVNGQLVSTLAVSGPIATSTGPVRIGGNGVWNEFFQGRIDEVRIYNRALSQAQVQTDMNTAVGGGPSTSDKTPPAISIASPGSSSSYYVKSSVLTVSGTASDNVGVTQVTWTNNRGGSGSATGTTSWSVGGITLQPGANLLTVTARDAAGNTTSAAFTATYDATAPSVSITSPVGGSTVSGTVAVTAAASDTVGVAGVQFLLDGVAIGAEQFSAPFSLAWATGGVANGAHILSARARDAAGNTALAANATVTVTNVGPPPSISGLVAAYAFNEGAGSTVADASGNNNTGTISGATWTTGGRFGSALVFNGGSAVVTIPSAASLQLTTGMTLEAWVYPTSMLSWWRSIVDKNVDQYYLMASSDQNRPAVGGTWGAGNRNLYGPAALPLNTWTHLAATFDGTTVRLYVNGVEVASQTQTTPLTTSTATLQIGGDAYSGENFAGRIDEVRIYNRALSPSEIQIDMNTAVGGP